MIPVAVVAAQAPARANFARGTVHPSSSISTMVSAVFGLFILLAGLLALVWMGQRSLIYFPARDVPAPRDLGLVNVEAVTFKTADAVTLHGWFLPAANSPSRWTVLVCNGNAGNRAHRAALGAVLRAHGMAVLLFDYRGYGENAGSPSEEGLAEDARSARRFLLGRGDVDPAGLIYFGESLGSGVVTGLAAEHPPAGLILRSPFPSLADVGQYHYPLLPVRLLLRDRYASVDRLAHISSPLLVIAGSRDRIVPLDLSRRFYDAASEPKTLAIIDGADHNDAALFAGEEMIGAIGRFLRQVG
jgi:fermentation-respiration switch protein FrsA (DUF1100 family)